MPLALTTSSDVCKIVVNGVSFVLLTPLEVKHTRNNTRRRLAQSMKQPLIACEHHFTVSQQQGGTKCSSSQTCMHIFYISRRTTSNPTHNLEVYHFQAYSLYLFSYAKHPPMPLRESGENITDQSIDRFQTPQIYGLTMATMIGI